MVKRRRSPKEKKALSYVKDGRNVVAEARGIAHRAITKRKKGANQALRREVHTKLTSGLRNAPDVESVDAFVARVGRKSWRKTPDIPLGEYVAGKVEGNPRKSSSTKAKLTPALGAARRKARKARGP